MAVPGALRVVNHGGQRFLCFCDGAGGAPRLSVTNGCALWSGDVPAEQLDRYFSPSEGATPDEDGGASKLRELLGCQTPAVTVCDSRATLQFRDGQRSLSVDLHKAPLSEARKQLQALVFGLAAQVQALQRRLEECADAAPPPLSSPEKNPVRSQGLFAPAVSPLKYLGGARGSQRAAKRRLPGESLINPGFKSKKPPTGVDFEDP